MIRFSVRFKRTWGLLAAHFMVIALAGASFAHAQSQPHKQAPLQIRAVQLDLARQKENLDFIRSFIDFSAKYGYNTLVLYLEGMIKTKSFPYPDADHSYTPDEIREIVRYAKEKKMEVIPVVPTLGHTEMFLQYPELKKLAELDGGVKGRFRNDLYCMTCPSRKDTYEFYSRYLAEVSELFPAKYFHVGLDESWDIGMCEVCRKRTECDGKSDRLYAEHITKIHGILAGLGKTMMMWDDMFELYPEALEHIPRDIVMCTWCYRPSMSLPIAHFLHQKNEDIFRKYDRMGFQYLFCPKMLYPDNSAAFTRYAQRYKPLGGLMTIWKRDECPLYDYYPSIAFSGILWRDGAAAADDDKLLNQVIEEAVGGDEATVNCLNSFYTLRNAWYAVELGFCRGEVTHREKEQARMERLIYETLQTAKTNDNPIVRNVLGDLRERLWRFKLRENLANLAARRAIGERHQMDCRPLFRELDGILSDRLAEWREARDGIPYNDLVSSFAAHKKTIEKNIAIIQDADCYLTIRFFLPDITVLPKMRIIAKDANGRGSILAEGVFKQPFYDAAYYDYIFPCTSVPNSVRLEAAGCGGQGVCFIKLEREGKTLEPESITSVEGAVSSPEHIFSDDLRWTYLGEGFVRDAFVVNDARKITNAIELTFRDP